VNEEVRCPKTNFSVLVAADPGAAISQGSFEIIKANKESSA
jgi:hypothetical protein